MFTSLFNNRTGNTIASQQLNKFTFFPWRRAGSGGRAPRGEGRAGRHGVEGAPPRQQLLQSHQQEESQEVPSFTYSVWAKPSYGARGTARSSLPSTPARQNQGWSEVHSPVWGRRGQQLPADSQAPSFLLEPGTVRGKMALPASPTRRGHGASRSEGNRALCEL